MVTPSKETIDAALNLAEGVTKAQSRGWTLPDVVEDEWHAYRATLPKPKLRSLSEVDAEIVVTVRTLVAIGCFPHMQGDNADRLKQLCAEPTRDDSGPSEEQESHEERHQRMNMAGIAKQFEILGRRWAREPQEPTPYTTGPGDEDADPPPCASPVATYSELREQFARFVYYNFGGWLTNDADREHSWERIRHLPAEVAELVEGFHAERVRTGEIPGWCKVP